MIRRTSAYFVGGFKLSNAIISVRTFVEVGIWKRPCLGRQPAGRHGRAAFAHLRRRLMIATHTATG